MFPTDSERARIAIERARGEERAQIAELAKAEADQEIARLRAEIEALRRK